jgi:hypothetical protein
MAATAAGPPAVSSSFNAAMISGDMAGIVDTIAGENQEFVCRPKLVSVCSERSSARGSAV